MSTSQQSQFACESCGKKYPWKPDYAGRKVKCECGHVMTAPDAPPEAPPAPAAQEDDLYDIADDPKPAPAKRVSPVAPPTATPSATAQASLRPPGSSTLAYQQAPKPRDTAKDFSNAIGGEPWRELYLPAALVLLGILLNVLLAMHESGKWVRLSSVLPFIGLTLLFNLVLSFAGILLVAKWFEIGFGHPATAILKMSACILLPTAIAGFVGGLLGHDSGFVDMMVRAILMFPLTTFSVMLLFQIDLNESIWCVAVIYVITDWVTKIIVAALLMGLISSTSSSSSGGGSSGSGASRGAYAQTLATGDDTKDAATWISKGNAALGQLTASQSVKLLQDFTAAGATQTKLHHPYQYRAYELVIGLPDDKDKRDAVIELYKKTVSQLGDIAEPVSKEDKYLLIEFPEGVEDPSLPAK